MTTIGILGSGHVGSSLARAAIAHGYDVVISNLQGPDTLTGLVQDLGPQARAATAAGAAAAGDFAIVAIPVTTIDQVPVEPLAGKVVIARSTTSPTGSVTLRRSTTERPQRPGCRRPTCPRAR